MHEYTLYWEHMGTPDEAVFEARGDKSAVKKVRKILGPGYDNWDTKILNVKLSREIPLD